MVQKNRNKSCQLQHQKNKKSDNKLSQTQKSTIKVEHWWYKKNKTKAVNYSIKKTTKRQINLSQTQ